MNKVFILGIDGATLDLIEPWTRQGKLPAFSRLMREGAYGTCLSTIHPLTPQAWASFLTGKNPGKHGLYDFGVRKQGTYDLRLTSSRDRRSKVIWNYVNESGLQAGVVNVPLTYPPEPLNGFMVSGMHTPSLDKGVSPKTLFNEIIDRFPQYQIDVMSYWFDSYDIFLKNLNKMTAARMQTAEYLYKKYKPELFLLVLVAADRVQHALWGQMAHPSNGNNKADWKYSRSVLGVYQQMDKFLNRIISLLDGDTALIVMSDHGFGSLKKDVYLNNFLIKSGFLTLKDNKWKKPFDWRKPFANIDWKSTKAYSYGLFGNIFINLKGREPRGIVNTGSQYEDVINSLINRLKTLKDPEDGEKIVTKVYRREELYHGPYLDEAPDLLICMKDYSYIARGGQEFSEQSLVSKPKINHSGNHRMNGAVFFLGPFIKKGLRLPDINIVDLCPTVLSIMELPVPDDMDGRVVNEVFEKMW